MWRGYLSSSSLASPCLYRIFSFFSLSIMVCARKSKGCIRCRLSFLRIYRSDLRHTRHSFPTFELGCVYTLQVATVAGANELLPRGGHGRRAARHTKIRIFFFLPLFKVEIDNMTPSCTNSNLYFCNFSLILLGIQI